MKATFNSRMFASLVVLATLAMSAMAQDARQSQQPAMSRGDAVLAEVTATVQAIDLNKREVTLKGPLGNVVSFVVDESVKRLDEVKVGDEVTARYYVSLAAELREPTAEELKNPLVVTEDAARAPKDAAPAAGKLRTIKAVATVVGLDLPTQSVTLQGPMGNYACVRAERVDTLKKLRLGDTIVVTYTEAVAVSLHKVPHETVEH
ncbi:MAG: hypothetical protein AB1714_27545 [Acidobacteriota bacterium]